MSRSTVTQLNTKICSNCKHWRPDSKMEGERFQPKLKTEGHPRTSKAGWCMLGSPGLLTLSRDKCPAFEAKETENVAYHKS